MAAEEAQVVESERMAAEASAKAEVVISVICPTTFSRRCFHSFLWDCFRMQTYSPRELVVIDTCEEGPSEFFVALAEKDERVIYQHYQVPEKKWSIGMKRNIACALASGHIIAHFDDDDIYAPCYLSDMFARLWGSDSPRSRFGGDVDVSDAHLSGPPAMGGFKAGCAKLSCWHTFNVPTGSWGLFDATKNGGEARTLYGWGFSYVYLRSIWAQSPFLDQGLGEDYDFLRAMLRMGVSVDLLYDKKGICGHAHHALNTSGVMEHCSQWLSKNHMEYSPCALLLQAHRNAIELSRAAQSHLPQRRRDGTLARPEPE